MDSSDADERSIHDRMGVGCPIIEGIYCMNICNVVEAPAVQYVKSERLKEKKNKLVNIKITNIIKA